MSTATQYIMGISLGLLVLILIEGMITIGSAFNFENYSAFGWIVQSILVIFTISLSITLVNDELKKQK
jgi:hypothetical protein